MQTDKPYYINSIREFEDIGGGMQFISPFGKGNRLIQGIVVDVLEEADTSEELKAIVEGLGLHSVLNQE